MNDCAAINYNRDIVLRRILLSPFSASDRFGLRNFQPSQPQPFSILMPSTEPNIRELCESAPNRREFYNTFLQWVGSQAGAVSGVVWDCDEHLFRPIAQIQSTTSGVFKVGVSEAEHNQLLHEAANSRQPVLISPKPNATGNVPADHPVILLATIQRQANRELVELFLPPGESNGEYQIKLGELERSCREASQFSDSANLSDAENLHDAPANALDLKNRTAVSSENAPTLSPQQLNQFVHRIHRSLDIKETSLEIANELRRVLDCDRVSVVQTFGLRQKILAISGQPTVNHRSNTVQQLRSVANRVLPLKSMFWFPTEAPLPEQIETPLQNYLAESTTRTMIVQPIFDVANEDNQNPHQPRTEPRLIGGLVIENSQSEWSRDSFSDLVQSTTDHAADAFRNSYQHRQLLFYPVWKWLGKSKIVLAARNLRIATAVLTGLVLLGLLLTFYPADFRLHCDGNLVPVNRQNVFADVDGTVTEILVQHGDQVSANQPLVKIKNHDFEYQYQELSGQIEEIQQTIASTESMRLKGQSSAEQETRQKNLQAQKAHLTSLQSQLELVQQKLDQLTIIAPADGQIVTWNVAETLRDRPVSRGEILLEVADVSGAWELELNLADRKVGHLLAALKSQKKAGESNGETASLDVDFLLAADPHQRFHGTIKEIGTATEIHSDNGQTIRIAVQIDAADFDIRQVKSGVSAQIHCGRQPLGYVWFHPVWEFIQAKVLFPLFG